MLLPQTLKRIENRAFEEDWCHAENIYDESLEDPLVEEHIITHGITELDIPPSVEYIGQGAFRCLEYGNMAGDKTKSIEKLTFHEGLKIIDKSAFYNRCHLSILEIPNSLVSIGDNAFNLNTIKHLILNHGVKHIGKHAFNCNMCNVTIPNNGVFVDVIAFASCNNIIFEEGVSHIDASAFEDVASAKFPTTIETIDYQALAGLLMDTIDLRGISIKYIDTNAFGYAKFKYAYIEGNNLVLAPRAFSEHRENADIHIGRGVVDIGDACFSCGLSYNYSTIDLSEATDLMHVGINAFFSMGAPAYIELPSKTNNLNEEKKWYAYYNSPDEIDFEHDTPVTEIKNMYQGDGHTCGYVARIVNTKSVETDIEPSYIATDVYKLLKTAKYAEIYNLSGQLIYKGEAQYFDTKNRGIYIAKIDNNRYKIAIK